MVVLEAANPRGIALFASGAGGDPRRYGTLLETLARSGQTVLAPADPRLDARTVTTDQVRERVVELKAALSEYADELLPVSVVGHSIGGTAALCLAGAQPWDRDAGQPFSVPTEARIARTVLLAPSLGWFGAPGALSHVGVPIEALAGAQDVVTPAASTDVLRSAPSPVRIHVYENVGHFDFMTDLPPGKTPAPGLDHAAFLDEMASRVASHL